MRKLAHVSVQTWRGWDPNDLFGGWFSALGGFKTLVETIGLFLGACLILPCLVPLVLQSIRTIMEVIIERKMAVHVMMLWKYKPLN
jgi:energy-converting hydrogenase Eha subunit G